MSASPGDPAFSAAAYPPATDDPDATGPDIASHGSEPAGAGTPAVRPSVPGYEILVELDRGGMGVVYKARQVGFNRIVALKMILSGAHAGAAERERFRIEAEAIARLQHPNIVQVYEVGEHEGKPYFSMEFCRGGSLARKLNRTPLPAKEAARLVETLARAVQAAHEKGVVHRDLKPGNVLATEDGTPKVVDFGLAKRMDAEGQTQSGAVMGTPSYMAPEQAAGKVKEVGPAADVYALGAILYECLTGRPPFKGPTTLDTLAQVVSDEPVRPRQLQPTTPIELEAICLKCLEKQPARRYGTASDLAADLGRWRRGEPVQARPVGRWGRARKWVRRHPMQTAVYGLLALLLLVGVGGGGAMWLWLRAEANAVEAVKSKGEAESARGTAEVARRRAEQLEGEAEKARDEIKSLHRQLTQNAYEDRTFLAQSEWDAGRVQHARDLLREAGDLQEELTPGQRLWEWDYLNRVLRPELAVLAEHGGAVSSVAFSPDGRRIATGSADHTVRLWDAESGKPLAVLKNFTGSFRAVAFSPDGRRIATAGQDQTARLWDAESGKPLAVLKGHTSQVSSVAFSPDGRRIATAGQDQTARLWDAESGKPLAVLKGHTSQVSSVAFSPDGRRIATVSQDQTARLWDAESGKSLAVLTSQIGPMISAAFSPDGRSLATVCNDGVRLWEAEAGKPLAVLHYRGAWCVAFSPDGRRIATTSIDHTARLWDAQGRALLSTLQGHTGQVLTAVFSPDGRRLATAGQDAAARLWDVASGKLLTVLQGHTDWINALAFSPDGRRIATASRDHTVRLWDAESGKPFAVMEGHTGRVRSVSLSPDGRQLATGSDDHTARLWDAESGKQLAAFEGHTGRVLSVSLSPDGRRLATGSDDHTARLWDAESGKPLAVLEGHAFDVAYVVFSPDGRRLATTAPDNTVRLWDVESSKPLAVLEGAGGPLAFSPDGRRIAANAGFVARVWNAQAAKHVPVVPSTKEIEAAARIWDVETGKPVAVIRHGVGPLAFSPNGARIANLGLRIDTVAEDLTARIWDAESGKPLAVLRGHANPINSLAYSPDGRRLATASDDHTARLWDAETGKQLAVLDGHADRVLSVAFSPDGRRVATASVDKTARLWDVESGRQVAVLEGHTDGVYFVSFSPDGRRIVTASFDKTERLWIASESPEQQQKRLSDQHQTWLEQQAAAAENAGDWFAAAFHLRQLILLRPGDADLKERLQMATAKLGK